MDGLFPEIFLPSPQIASSLKHTTLGKSKDSHHDKMWVFKKKNSKFFLMALAVIVLIQLLQLQAVVSLYHNVEIDEYIPKDASTQIRNIISGLEKINAPTLKNAYKTEKAKELAWDSDFAFTKEYLLNVLDVPPTTVTKLKEAYLRYMHFMYESPESSTLETFGSHSSSASGWANYQGSRGIVFVGGGKFSWNAYMSIQQLRKVGCKLPVEVFIPTSREYDKKFCQEVLPKHNAKCIVFDPAIYKNLHSKFKIGGYQYKILALLTTSFESVLYLDSDVFAFKNPEYLFDLDLYVQNGLLLWPDFWARTTNPQFYDIRGKPVIEQKISFSDAELKNEESLKPMVEYTFADSNFHTFKNALPGPTTEAGAIVVNKSSHVRTLQLALFFNIHGPKFFYPLLTQGSAGEGDKETFMAAALSLGETFAQSESMFDWIGYFEDGDFYGKGLGMKDPAAGLDEKSLSYVFLHCSYPKYYPELLEGYKELVHRINHEDVQIRMYPNAYEKAGFDVDLRLMQLFVEGVCESYYGDDELGIAAKAEFYAGNFLSFVSGEAHENEKRCQEVFLPHLKFLRETTEYPET